MDYFSALNAFVEAARQSNFSRAAERLEVKASTISRYVRDLEADLGIALFNRSTRALRLTEGGRTFLVHAQRVLDELEVARAAASSLNDEPRGVLQLNAPPAFARHHIVPALSEFRVRFPQIQVDLTCEESQVNLIDAGADLAIRLGCLPDSSLKARKIADEQWVLCAAPSLWHEPSGPEHPEALTDQGFIASSQRLDLYWSQAGETVRQSHTVALRTNDLEAQLVAAQAGQGPVLLPAWLAATAIRQGTLVRWLSAWRCQPGEVGTSLWFIYPPKRIVSSKVRSFIDFMVQRIGEAPYWRL
ncbi:LysR substrate-binding domain-containing protein [Pseudomonas aeruginosa]|uniref:LysR family transcriptional regulator n=1 Tax=Pseudomonas aeruginosa TaxID=287 RepID=UPI00149568E1|nr:LysR family transcriptional regulator [Pseudomonas aeruginosa]MCU9211717.1 LysR substrate-binding domain-containing protein [Pseudomonas aeruginosa]HCE6123328.1 LysR family transcriptional regulator [Pseudomonas aeruginosa]